MDHRVGRAVGRSELRLIDEDISKRLDKVLVALHGIVTRRPEVCLPDMREERRRLGCPHLQAPTMAPLMEGGLLTEALVNDVVVSWCRSKPTICRATGNRTSRAMA